jgi:hypothetical protein
MILQNALVSKSLLWHVCCFAVDRKLNGPEVMIIRNQYHDYYYLSGSHSSEYEDYGVLGCYTIYFVR